MAAQARPTRRRQGVSRQQSCSKLHSVPWVLFHPATLHECTLCDKEEANFCWFDPLSARKDEKKVVQQAKVLCLDLKSSWGKKNPLLSTQIARLVFSSWASTPSAFQPQCRCSEGLPFQQTWTWLVVAPVSNTTSLGHTDQSEGRNFVLFSEGVGWDSRHEINLIPENGGLAKHTRGGGTDIPL